MTAQEMQTRRLELRGRWASLTEAERDEYTALTRTLASEGFQANGTALVTAEQANSLSRYAGKRQN